MNAISKIATNAGQTERQRIRIGAFTGPTSGLAPGNVQANMVFLPKDLANDFLRFAQANPKPCPVLAVSEVGSPHFPTLGADLDLRTDLPRYRVWRDGELRVVIVVGVDADSIGEGRKSYRSFDVGPDHGSGSAGNTGRLQILPNDSTGLGDRSTQCKSQAVENRLLR